MLCCTAAEQIRVIPNYFSGNKVPSTFLLPIRNTYTTGCLCPIVIGTVIVCGTPALN